MRYRELKASKDSVSWAWEPGPELCRIAKRTRDQFEPPREVGKMGEGVQLDRVSSQLTCESSWSGSQPQGYRCP